MMVEFDSVHNYYERLVFDEIQDHYLKSGLDEDELADMACIALNAITPRYIRHDVDMSFLMSGPEHIVVRNTVKQAVKDAFNKIQSLDKHEE